MERRQPCGVGGEHRRGNRLWGVTGSSLLTVASFGAGVGVSALSTPLYPLYEHRDSFGAGTVTLVFAAFSLSVAVTLVFLGSLSDRLGRRAVLIPALLLDGVSCAIFAWWPALPGLIIARAVCGVAVGMIATTATAQLTDLAATDERRMPASPETLATIGNLGGVGIGAIVAGLLAQYAGSPLQSPYLIYLGALLLLALLTLRDPERPPASDSGMISATGATESPAVYLGAAVGAMLALASLGLFASLVPSFLAETLHRRSHLLAGGAAFLAFTSAAMGQLLLTRRQPDRPLPYGFGLLLGGLACMTLGMWISSIPLVLLSGVSCGIGAGVVFKVSVGMAVSSAPSDRRAGAPTLIYLTSYLGLAGSILGLGFLTRIVNPETALSLFVFAIYSAAGFIFASFLRARRPRR